MMIWQNYLETYFPILPHNWYVQLKNFHAVSMLSTALKTCITARRDGIGTGELGCQEFIAKSVTLDSSVLPGLYPTPSEDLLPVIMGSRILTFHICIVIIAA